MSPRPLCPEALYGQHGEPNTSGRCPYCGLVLRGRGKGIGRPQIARELYLERLERRYDRDMWGQVGIPFDQDPAVEPDFADEYYG